MLLIALRVFEGCFLASPSAILSVYQGRGFQETEL
jgi:hypothetical protein